MIGQQFTQTGAVSDSKIAAHLRQVFNYMTGGVALSGVVAYFTLGSPEMMGIAVKSSWVFFAIWIGFGFFMQKIIFSMQPTAALGVFIAFSALTGFSLAPMVHAYTGESVTIAFVVASAMFGGASLYGYVSKKSLSGWTSFLSMGAIGLFVAIIANIFMGSSGMSFMISLIAVPLVAAITAYEINMIKETFVQYANDDVMRSRMSILNAAGLYMNFVVIFIHLLSLLGERE